MSAGCTESTERDVFSVGHAVGPGQGGKPSHSVVISWSGAGYCETGNSATRGKIAQFEVFEDIARHEGMQEERFAIGNWTVEPCLQGGTCREILPEVSAGSYLLTMEAANPLSK